MNERENECGVLYVRASNEMTICPASQQQAGRSKAAALSRLIHTAYSDIKARVEIG